MRNLDRPILAACALLLLTAGGAMAAPAGIAAAFGNTVKATYPDGRFQRYWFKADHTWHAIGRRGTASSGKWTQNGETVCLKQTKPFPAPLKYCTNFPSTGAVGSSWPSKDAGGGRITLSLVKGAA
ncbi:hypothetical protein [Phenylobacterium sp.]|uniref:hypothetical protein n=1 Tax=Phenylobacterium sp. TaxID=1871053 RepID=UPI0025DD3254|nr:hypothetical protein [Phenylobacterium sp.]